MEILGLNLTIEEMAKLTGLTEDQLYSYTDGGQISLLDKEELEEISRNETTRTVRVKLTYIVPPNAVTYEVENSVPEHKDGFWSLFSIEETQNEPLDWEAHFKARAERYDHWLSSMFPLISD